jgi:hypothetical protein
MTSHDNASGLPDLVMLACLGRGTKQLRLNSQMTSLSCHCPTPIGQSRKLGNASQPPLDHPIKSDDDNT